MKEKLGLGMKKYIILGACSPPNAYKAILAEENTGLMLPCNVIVYEKGSKTGKGQQDSTFRHTAGGCHADD